MGRVISQNWTVETLLDYDFRYGDHKIEIIGAARMEYNYDENESNIEVYFPRVETTPELALRIRVDGNEMDRDSALFEAIADYLVEVLQNEITTTKTDLTNDDFADYDNDLLEELLDEL